MNFIGTNTIYWKILISVNILSILFLIGCTENEKTEASDSDSPMVKEPLIGLIDKQEADLLLTFYYGANRNNVLYKYGPSGTIKVEFSNSNGEERTVYILPDRKNIVEGIMYSPDMKPDQITLSHSKIALSRAEMNDRRLVNKAQMRRKISSAILNNNKRSIKSEVTNAVNQRIAADSNALATHNTNLAKTISETNPPPQTASLPRNNTVIDKDALYEDIEAANWISEGSGKKVLYVFFDFRCKGCLEAHKELSKYIASNEVEVRYLPVGMLGKESAYRATLSLMPTDNIHKLKLMKKLMSKQKLKELITKKPLLSDVERGSRASVHNLSLLLKNQRVGTPTFAFKTENGIKIKLFSSEREIANAINEIVDS